MKTLSTSLLLAVIGATSLSFGATPAQHQTVFIDRDYYQNVIHPPEYWGRAVAELTGQGLFNVNPPTVNVADITWVDGDNDGFGDVPGNVSWELKEHYLLNQLVEDLGADPIALAGYVQNEISLTQGFQSVDGGAALLQSATIVRGAYGAYLERQGSPWEQCALLTYLLRRAGYPAAVVESAEFATLMRVDRLDRTLGLRLVEAFGPDDVLQVDFPWVIVNDEKDGSGEWRHVFPWLKDVIFEEGFDPYQFLPSAYDSGEKWTDRYLQNDPAITSLIGEDGKDTPGTLFPRFLEQYLPDEAISLEDIGFRSYNRKNQYNEWDDLPKPFWVASLISGQEGDPVDLIVKADDLVATDQSRFAGIQISVRDQFNQLYLQTTALPLAQLTNRKLYFYRDGFSSMGLRMSVLNPEDSASPTGNFTTTNLTGPQLQTQVDFGFNLRLEFTLFNVFPNSGGTLIESRPLPESGVSAIVINTGVVTDVMMDQLVREFDAIQAAGVPSANELFANNAFIVGQQYWKNAGQEREELRRLHKIYSQGDFGVCVSSLRDEGVGYPTVPQVDIPVGFQIYVDATIHPQENPQTPPDAIGKRDIAIMEAANLSAHEHQVLNQFYGVDNAISTVKLLQIANRDFASGAGLNPEGYYKFTRSQFDAANTDSNYAGLRADSGTQWSTARDGLGLTGSGYVEAGWERIYSTPFPIEMDTDVGETATFEGMGLLYTSRTGIGALISNDLLGGYGPELTENPYSPANRDDLNVNVDGECNVTLDSDGEADHPTGDTTPDPMTQTEREQANEQNGIDPASDQTANDKGSVGPAENNDSQDDVADPVDPITGKLTMDYVDLTLHGPFSLQLRRNYSSLNPAHNLLGYGWKINFMPYLNVTADESAIYAADLDGTVVRYEKVVGSSPERWEPSTDQADNPFLDNNDNGSIGGQSNRYQAYFEKTTEGPDTVFTLYKPNGHEARYIVRSFPKDFGSGTVDRTRPYLDTWEDAFGNMMAFTYYEDSALSEYGQLRQIQSSNGNFLGFLYNRNDEITEAYTNDGRRVYYSYDSSGDLREVRLPDSAVITYDYLYLTESSGEVYSTHLISRCTKPDGRVIENTYDPRYDPEDATFSDLKYRRVVAQSATVGDTLELVENANFAYFESGDSVAALADDFTPASLTGADRTAFQTNLVDHAQAWLDDAGGYDVTIVISRVRSQYPNLTTVFVHKDGLKRFIAEPLAPTAFGPGNTNLDYVITYDWYEDGEANGYPRSLKLMRDKRGLETHYQYDALGNVSQILKRGDITGDGTPEDVITHYFYDTANFLPEKIIYPAEEAGATNRIVLYNYPDTGSAKSAPDTANSGFELYRYLPSRLTTYEVVNPAIDNSTPSSTDEQHTITYLYDSETDGTDSAFGVLKSRRHQGADDLDDRSRMDYVYNARGFVTQSTDFTFSSDANVVTTFQYNDRGELEVLTDNAGRVTRFDYDMLGRHTSTEKFTSSSASTPTWWNFNHYNLNGEVTWNDGPRYEPEDYVFRDYDGVGRMIAEVVWRSEARTDGSGVHAVADQNTWQGQAITYFDYDAFGNVESIIDPRGNETTLTYDELGRLEMRTFPTVDSVTATEQFSYEPGGLVAAYTNPLGGTATSVYTDYGRIKQHDRPVVDGRSESWTYTLDGRIATHTRSNRAVTTFTYDDPARTETRETEKDGTLLAKDILYFDTRGNLVQKDVFYNETEFYTFTYEYDGLNRITREIGPPEESRSAFSETASAQQNTSFSYTYSTTGDRYTVNATTDGEQAIRVFDGIGRLSRVENRDGSNNLQFLENYTYDDNHHFVTTSRGSSTADDMARTDWTNTFGQNVLSVFKDGTYSRRVYDKAGNLIEFYDEATTTDGSPRYEYSYDERNRLNVETKLDNSETVFDYDAYSNLIRREMPGGIIHHRAFDAANRLTSEYLEGTDASRSREVDYAYYTSGEDIGLLETRTENDGTSDAITHSYFYDDLHRLSRYTCDGANYVGVDQRYNYDLRSLLTSVTRAPLSGINTEMPTTRITQEIDGYGQILEERVYTGTGAANALVPNRLHSHVRQGWDALGRRSLIGMGADATPMGGIAPAFTYDFYASGRIRTITPNAVSSDWQVQYDYDDNNLLGESRLEVSWNGGANSYYARSTQTLNRRDEIGDPFRDPRGRLLRSRQFKDVSGTPTEILNERMTWNDDSKLASCQIVRNPGTGSTWGDFTENRAYTYDPDNRRLETESFLLEPGAGSRTISYDFDADNLGVRVGATLDNPATTAWEVPNLATTGLDAFMRVVSETVQDEERSFVVKGTTTGPGSFSLFLDGDFLQTIHPDPDYGDGTWQAPLSLEAGSYSLEARADHIHPDSTFTDQDTINFDVAAPDPYSIATTYDRHGRVETRSWDSGMVTQTFTWDAQSNLLKIVQTDAKPTPTYASYTWTAAYDAFGRRLYTEYQPTGANSLVASKNRINHWFDPQVNFLTIAVEHHGKREWKVHGPDLDNAYGSLQGIGGLEVIIGEADGKITPVIDSTQGHVLATIDLGTHNDPNDDVTNWKEAQFSGFGPLPGSQMRPLEFTESIVDSLGWQGRCIDPTHFFGMGFRVYDPLSGRFLSADPLGHGATPDLYSYAGGDPINFVDPTGLGAVPGVAENEPIGLMDGVWEAAMRGKDEYHEGMMRGLGNFAKGILELPGTVKRGIEGIGTLAGEVVYEDGLNFGSTEAALSATADLAVATAQSTYDAAVETATDPGKLGEFVGETLGDIATGRAALKVLDNAKSCRRCFVAGTLVLTGDEAFVPIEALELGDLVLTDETVGGGRTIEHENFFTYTLIVETNDGERPTTITTLRSADWADQHGLAVGEWTEAKFASWGIDGLAYLQSAERFTGTVDLSGTQGRPVTATFLRIDDLPKVALAVGDSGESIIVTLEHPFYSEDRQAWVPAGDLQPGESLRTAAEKPVRVTGVELLEGSETVYNIEVAFDHNFYVSYAAVLCHNCGDELDRRDFGEGPEADAMNLRRGHEIGASEYPYNRPGWREGVREQVREQARDVDGVVRSPSRRIIPDDADFDIGHYPEPFREIRQRAEEGNWTREEFIDTNNDLDNLRPELPEDNRGGLWE